MFWVCMPSMWPNSIGSGLMRCVVAKHLDAHAVAEPVAVRIAVGGGTTGNVMWFVMLTYGAWPQTMFVCVASVAH